MKVTNVNLDERIHVLKSTSTFMSVIKEIAESGMQEEAFYVLDVGDIVRKHQIWKEKLPRVHPFYAVKCNDSLPVLEVLAAIGVGFDCASKNEINKVLDLGVDTDRIIFANPAKPSSHIRHAESVGVRLMTVDNESELYKIKRIFPAAKIVLRIRCDSELAQCQLGMKFGCDPVYDAPTLLRLAKVLDLDVIGISFHVGSGCQDPPVYNRAIAQSRTLFDLATDIGFKPYLLDLGGGYPGDRGTSIDVFADVINDSLDQYFPSDDVHVIAEPGRFYVASAFTLATCIHSKRVVRANVNDPDKVTHHMYYINDGVYGSFNCLLYDHQQVTPIPLRPGSGKLVPSSIWGPTCDGLDQVVDNVMLHEMELGDWIIFENMGAYTLPVASPFNGFPIPKVHVVADESMWSLLKGAWPLTEAHFVVNDIPETIHRGLDISGENVTWDNPSIELTTLEEQGSEGDITPPFIYDFVDVGPLN